MGSLVQNGVKKSRFEISFNEKSKKLDDNFD